MTISSMQQDHNNYRVCVSSTFLLLLTPSTIASYSPASHLGWASMALSSTGLSRTSSRSFRVRCYNTFSSFYTCSCGDTQGSFLGHLLFIIYTSPSVLSCSPFPWNAPFMQTTPNCLFSHFTRPTSTQASPTCKMPFSKSLPGWLPIF